MRWSDRAGCEWPEHPQPYATLDLDQYVPGPETQAFRLESGCADGINIELWMGEGSSHSPGYGDAFANALVDWLLSQELVFRPFGDRKAQVRLCLLPDGLQVGLLRLQCDAGRSL